MKDNNKFEVGFAPDDATNRRLPGSVQYEPVRGDSAYGPGKNNFAKPTTLDAKPTGGVVGVPYIDSGFGMEDDMAPSLNANVDVRNSDTSLNTTYDHNNRSAQYKYPSKSQDNPAKGGTQYEDHT
jgi:hypothetical protein